MVLHLEFRCYSHTCPAVAPLTDLLAQFDELHLCRHVPHGPHTLAQVVSSISGSISEFGRNLCPRLFSLLLSRSLTSQMLHPPSNDFIYSKEGEKQEATDLFLTPPSSKSERGEEGEEEDRRCHRVPCHVSLSDRLSVLKGRCRHLGELTGFAVHARWLCTLNDSDTSGLTAASLLLLLQLPLDGRLHLRVAEGRGTEFRRMRSDRAVPQHQGPETIVRAEADLILPVDRGRGHPQTPRRLGAHFHLPVVPPGGEGFGAQDDVVEREALWVVGQVGLDSSHADAGATRRHPQARELPQTAKLGIDHLLQTSCSLLKHREDSHQQQHGTDVVMLPL
ncbi:hypothetical protein EYF80_011983 [Liparis tanakae]|uniref:Uncharacterized protein n=1 Tax=Liparis tanakae TaxID=230148 RepID=A0A4Z2IIV2_9TELE|nr:hypothetical protein EYF80_011983 [Liparis tanakae]